MEIEEPKEKGGKRGGAGRPGGRKGARAEGGPRGGGAKRAAKAAAATGGAAVVRAGKGGRGRGGGKAIAKLVGGLKRRRVFDSGELRLVLLKLIADEPRHGYELIKSVEDLTSGGYAPSPGVIYPTLTMLDEIGYVSGEDAGEGRRRFTVTEEGKAHLAENGEQIDKLFGRLATMGEKHQRTDSMPVRRAMSNLKVALQDRLGRGETSDETLLQVAALIDEAAQKIERLG